MNCMPVAPKRTFNMFANLKHYNNVKNPLNPQTEQIYHSEIYNQSNIENYKNQISEQQTRIQNLENRISNLNSEIESKSHKMLHSVEDAAQIAKLKEEVTSLQAARNDLTSRFEQEISSIKLQFEQRGIELENINKKSRMVHENEMKILQNEAQKMSYEVQKAKETSSSEQKVLQTKIDALNKNNTLLSEKNKISNDEVAILKKQVEEIELKNRDLLISKDESIRSLQSNIYNLENKIKLMTTDLQGKSSIEMESKMYEIQNLQRTVENMKEDLARQKKENAELKRLKEIENQKYITSEDKVRNLQIEIDRKKNEILNAQSDLSRAQNEMSVIKSELTRKEDAISKLERKNMENESKLREYENSIDRFKNEKFALERNIESRNYGTSVELKEMEDKVKSFEDKIKKLEEEKSTLATNFTNETVKVQNLINLKERAEREIQELKTLDIKKSREMDVKFQNSLLDFSSKEMKVDGMIKQMQSDLDSLRREKDAAEAKIRDLTATLAKKELEIIKYNDTINGYSADLDKIKYELKSFKDKANFVENNNLDSAQKVIASLRSIVNLNNGMNSSDLLTLINDLENSHRNKSLDNFLLNIPKLTSVIKNLISQNEDKGMIDMQKNTQIISQLKAQIFTLASNLKDAQNLSETFKTKSAELGQNLSDFTNVEATLKKTIYEFQNQVGQYQIKVRDLTDKNALLEEQLTNSKLQLQDSTENIAILDKNLIRVKNENNDLIKRLDEISYAEQQKNILSFDEKFFKPSLKFIIMLFSKEVFEERFFIAQNASPDTVSSSLAYWADLLTIASNSRWIVEYVAMNKYRLKTEQNEFFQGVNGLEVLNNTFESARINAISNNFNFFGLNILYWAVHKKILKYLVRGITGESPIVNLNITSKVINAFMRSTTSSDDKNFVIDFPTQEHTYLGSYSWHSTPSFVINDNKYIEKYVRGLKSDEMDFAFTLCAFELMKDCFSLEYILSTTNCGLRKKNEYFSELSYAYANEDTPGYKFLELTKFHAFHYFSKLSYTDTLDFSNCIQTLKLAQEKEEKGNNAAQISKMKHRIKLKSDYRKNKYKNGGKEQKVENKMVADFKEINLPIDQNNVNPEIDIDDVNEGVMEDLSVTKVKLDEDATITADDDVMQMYTDFTKVENLTDPGFLTLHKSQTAVRNGADQNVINQKRKVYKASTPGNKVEKNLIVILNSLKPKIPEVTAGGEIIQNSNIVGNAINVV